MYIFFSTVANVLNVNPVSELAVTIIVLTNDSGVRGKQLLGLQCKFSLCESHLYSF